MRYKFRRNINGKNKAKRLRDTIKYRGAVEVLESDGVYRYAEGAKTSYSPTYPSFYKI